MRGRRTRQRRAVLIMTWFADRSWTEAFCVCPEPLYEAVRCAVPRKSRPEAEAPRPVATRASDRLRRRRPTPRVTGTGRSASPPPPRHSAQEPSFNPGVPPAVRAALFVNELDVVEDRSGSGSATARSVRPARLREGAPASPSAAATHGRGSDGPRPESTRHKSLGISMWAVSYQLPARPRSALLLVPRPPSLVPSSLGWVGFEPTSDRL